jgi:hypothetical protein
MPGFVPGIYVSTVPQQGKTSVAGIGERSDAVLQTAIGERNQRRPSDGYARS